MITETDTTEAAAELASKQRIREKWGSAITGGGLTGFLAIPEVLIRSQHRLRLTSTEMMVLINVLMHWWYADRKPFPGNYPIANRMGVSRRTVQRAIKKMEAEGLIKTIIQTYTEDDRPLRKTDIEHGADPERADVLKTPYDGVGVSGHFMQKVPLRNSI